MKERTISLSQFTAGVILYNFAVILWGAYVRASGSGAGCGDHWPLCQAQVFPQLANTHTQVEFFHRASSGLSLILVLSVVFWTLKKFPKQKFVRAASWIAGVSILIEAALGAFLVLFRLVSNDQSFARVIAMSIHFANTLTLIGSLTLIATASSREGRGWENAPRALLKSARLFALLVFLLGMLGAMAALGDTLFPAASLSQSLSDDWNHLSHFLIRIRISHPIVALILIASFIPWSLSKIDFRANKIQKRWGTIAIALLCTNALLGITNIIWLTPIPLQILHLGIGLIFWIALVLFIDSLATTTQPNSSLMQNSL